MTEDKHDKTIHECIGVFTDVSNLRSSIDDLLAAGFHRNQLGLLASEIAVREKLGDFNTGPEESSQAPAISFVDERGLTESGQSIGGGLFLIGTAGIAGAVVSSAAILGGSLLTALSVPVGVGIVALAVAKIIHQGDADFLQQQIDEGKLLLFVTIDPADEEKAGRILENNKALEVRIVDAPVSSRS